MADSTDWNDLRISGESWLECEDTQGAHDLSHWALDFIPADPNKAADAEWLRERGWVKIDGKSGWLSSPSKRLEWVNAPDETFTPGLYVNDSDPIPNPSRMTVALFEAAAMEMMKHG